ncbi:hypothetical protein ACIBEK_18395 [Nocardia fusca]|uniref:hypothetical protein n=1 Tax=Nocardia fusca TaxID=941183 RepID=UPI0037A16B3D
MDISAVQVETLTREAGKAGRILTEDGRCVGAVVRDPLLEEAFGGGAMGSVVEAEAVEEDCEVDIGLEPLG